MIRLLLLALNLALAADPNLILKLEPVESVEASKKIGDRIGLRILDEGKLSWNPQAAYALEPVDSKSNLIQQGWTAEVEIPQPQDPRLLVVPLKSGELKLPPLWILDEKGVKVAQTSEWFLHVEPLEAGKDQAAEFLDPMSLPFPWLIASVVGAIVLILLVILITMILRQLKRNRPQAALEPSKPLLPEDEEALFKLLELDRAELWKHSRHKELYFGVSETLKRYAGRRYEVDAMEKTSDELVHLLSKHLSAAHLEELRGIFSPLDLVKFTDHVPSAGESKLIVDQARRFVMNTRRVPVTQEASKGVGRAV